MDAGRFRMPNVELYQSPKLDGIYLAAIDGHGLDIDEMLVVANTLFAYVRGHAAAEVCEREASVRSRKPAFSE